MDNVIQNLREKSILHRYQVQQIKQYIDVKYSDYTSSHKASIFAKAVHQIVDESVNRFEEKHRMQIRTEVLKSAIVKDLFEINGYDVFEVCATLPIADDADSKDKFYANLTQWVNENQEEVVSIDRVQTMATSVLDQTVSSLVDMLEESILVDKDIIEMNHHDQREVIKERLSIIEESVNTETSSGHQVDNDEPSNDNKLEDFVSDGRFMNTEGEPIHLSSEDIERALRGEMVVEESVVEDKEAQVLTSDIIDTAYSALGPRNEKEDTPRDQVDELSEKEDKDQASLAQINNVVYSNEGEEIFDSMDLVFSEKGADEELEEASGNIDLGPVDDDKWEDADFKQAKQVKTTRLKGYEINLAKDDKVEKELLPQNYRLLLILPVVMILIMLFIVLIVGAIQISRQVLVDEIKVANNIDVRDIGIQDTDIQVQGLYVQDIGIRDMDVQGIDIQDIENDDRKEVFDQSVLDHKTLRQLYIDDGQNKI